MARAATMSTDFQNRAEEWAGVIFADIAKTSPTEASLSGDIADDTSTTAEDGAKAPLTG